MTSDRNTPMQKRESVNQQFLGLLDSVAAHLHSLKEEGASSIVADP